MMKNKIQRKLLGNEEETSTEEKKTIEVPVNAEEVLTKDNFNKVREIIEKRLNYLNTEEYDIRVDSETGKIILNMPEETKTDDIATIITQPGDFNIIATDTEEVLLTKNDIKNIDVKRYRRDDGTLVYLEIQFKNDVRQKLEDISKEYVTITEEDGTTKNKTVSLKIDDQNFMTTYFDSTEPIVSGEIQITIGSASNDQITINEYLTSARYIVALLSNDTLPIVYTNGENKHISPIVDTELLQNIEIISIILLVLISIYMIVRHKENGILAFVALLGYLAFVMLLIRFTNVPIAIGSMVAIVLSALMEIVLLEQLLKAGTNKKMDETIIKTMLNQIPLYIIAVVLCFVTLVPMVSFGTALFWGLITATVYNYFVAKHLLLD